MNDHPPRCPQCRRWHSVVYRNGKLYCTKCKIEWPAPQ